MCLTSPDYFRLADNIGESVLASIPLPGDVDTMTSSTGASESSTLSSQHSTSRDVDVDILHPGECTIQYIYDLYLKLWYLCISQS